MIEFLTALGQHEFLQRMVICALLASVSCGVVGSFVVVRRISYLAGSIAHCVLAGMGAAGYLNKVHGVNITPMVGAVVAALVAALIIGLVSLRAKEREDTVIGAVWAIGMAVGFLFIHKTPGYNQDLMSYLFGSITLVGMSDIVLLAVLDLVVVVTVLLFFNPLVAVCFDEEFARLRGIHVEFWYLLLLCLAALTVVLLVSVVGIVLVIALLTLPVAIASQFSRKLLTIMILATVVTATLTLGGIVVSYRPGWPASATIITLAGSVYLIVLMLKRLIRARPSA